MPKKPPGQKYAIFKMDDLASQWWKEWKILTDIVKAENVKAGLGIWFSSILEGDSAYDAWIDEIAADDRFELWSHGFTGHGPKDEPGMEHKGTSYEFQKNSFDRAREAMLTRCDKVLRTFSEHWHGGDATTLKVFNEDPFLRVWMCWGWIQRRERIRDVIADRRILDDNPVDIEFADPKNWTPGYVNFSEFEKSYRGHENDPYLVLQGHPWSWTDTSSKPDRTGAALDRWGEFRKIIGFLRARDYRFANPYEYYRIVRGHAADTRAPAAPAGLKAARTDKDSVSLNWNPAPQGGPAVDCYKIYKDGKPAGLSVEPFWTGKFDALADSTTFSVVAVSKNEIPSPRTEVRF